MCKGADVAILSRLSRDVYERDQDQKLIYMKENILRRMKRHTLKGYRGLLMAIRFLSHAELKRFKRAHARICQMGVRQKRAAYRDFLRELESDLVLIGGSAVEDRLQEGLRDTIQSFRRAQMKIWVLTGDKMETAENIAVASGLFKRVGRAGANRRARGSGSGASPGSRTSPSTRPAASSTTWWSAAACSTRCTTTRCRRRTSRRAGCGRSSGSSC